MAWIRRSNACQMKRIRRRFGVPADSTLEAEIETSNKAATARREVTVVSSKWAVIEGGRRSRREGLGGCVAILLALVRGDREGGN